MTQRLRTDQNIKISAVFRLRIRNHFLVSKTEQRDGTHSYRNHEKTNASAQGSIAVPMRAPGERNGARRAARRRAVVASCRAQANCVASRSPQQCARPGDRKYNNTLLMRTNPPSRECRRQRFRPTYLAPQPRSPSPSETMPPGQPHRLAPRRMPLRRRCQDRHGSMSGVA